MVTCPTCGSPVQVVSSGEGTNHYEPAAAPAEGLPVEGDTMDLLEAAWGIIANANGGNWDTASPEWREAAIRWRDRLFASPEWKAHMAELDRHERSESAASGSAAQSAGSE